MTLLQPKTSNQFPEGGYGFVDSRTGFKVNGWEGTPQMHAVKIRDHRRANPKHYPPGEPQWFDTASIIQEIYGQKVKTHPHLFRGYADTVQTVSSPAPLTTVGPEVKCKHCGSSKFKPIYCLSCGGNRVKGWKCESCNTDL